ncbi:hypothetical protein EC973_001297 [Apophysomyces ossiformis]|uniref:Importin-13 n=1 Tax=Apophysomyces ossiformis TaxID=679940 RepID=A0A8H7BI11_9FUNG|nr:hypothetical protein EC973_001297 [Apophysomyces ossiformis]
MLRACFCDDKVMLSGLQLITYAFHTVPGQWEHFVPASVNAMEQGAQAYGVPARHVQLTILEFFTLLPEEMSNAEILGGRKASLMQELKDSVSLVLATLSSFLLASDLGSDVTVQQKALKCLQSWIQYGIDLEDVYPLLRQTMIFTGHDELFESAIEVLLEAMQQSAWAKYMTLRDDLLNCLTSEWMRSRFAACIEEEDADTGRTLAKLFSTYGETFTDFLSIQLASPNISLLLDMIMQLTAFQGHFPVDQEVSDISLNFWYVLQETLFDQGIIPVRENTSEARDGDDDVSLKSDSNVEQKLWIRRCGEAAMVVYRQLVTTLMQKAVFPENSVWESWNRDLKDKFRIYRRDLGDTMINPYYVLRDEMTAILLQQSISILNHWESTPFASQKLEATLFCLKSISEEIPADTDANIAQFFGTEVLGRLPANSDFRLKNTILLLMGSLAEWFKKHSEFLPSLMNFIVPCLSSPKLAPAAAAAFADICDTCRNSLIGELDNLMHVYGAMAACQIPANIMQKVVESVADVIQVLPPESAIAPLMTLTGDIIQVIRNALNLVKRDPDGARLVILTQLQYLSACCRGIQSPNDDYQSISARNSAYDAYASGQSTVILSNIDGFPQITAAIQESVQQIASVWSGDEQVMKVCKQTLALTHFLESGIRSTSPLLALDFHALAALIESNYAQSPFSCWLDLTTFMMTVYGGHNQNIARLRDILGLLTEKTLSFINGPQGMEQHPDIIDSYFDLLSRTITRCPMVFYQLPRAMIDTIFMFGIAGMNLQERLALKATLNFMADFVSQSFEEGSQAAEVVNTIVLNMGLQMMEQLLMGIGGRVPRSFSGPLVDVLYKLTGRYLEACRHWLQVLLAHDGFPSSLVTRDDKDYFMKGVLGTRSFKRFKEIAHGFSVKCRGLGDVV